MKYIYRKNMNSQDTYKYNNVVHGMYILPNKELYYANLINFL